MTDFKTKIIRRRIHVDGVVQGVGFRPFIYGLAMRHKLPGWVLNSSSGVDIEVDGRPDVLDAFQSAISTESPPLAVIDQVLAETVTIDDPFDVFIIKHSAADGGTSLISPDVATCADCQYEIFHSADRRYRYPFTNCTNCGPRYTIIQDMPYDRPMTTMRCFPMCPDCLAEYEDPLNRRFHAQPNACPVCGPQVTLIADAELLADLSPDMDDIQCAAALLKAGHIVAVKGLGGFHLACDASNDAAVARLRARKHRPDKPFAVMMPDLDGVRAYCHVNDDEAALLGAVSAPVVLLYVRDDAALAPSVAPDNPMLGVMLAYTPLHHLLLRDAGVPLVMTSGNLRHMPIITDNDEALAQLGGIADAFLLHSRPIHMRCDDAVWWVDRFAGEGDAALQPLRRSRGDAPYPIRLAWEGEQSVLAVGAEMKNTFCLLNGSDVFLSQHIGEVDSLEALDYFKEALDHLRGLFKFTPDVIAHDMHPGYLTTRLAHELSAQFGVPRVEVQHHHAHIAACIAEHGLDQPVIGLSLDGTGYGPDGAIWGGEVLLADLPGYERFSHLEYMPLPGGAAAVRRPYRIAWGYLWETLGEIPLLPTLSHINPQERDIVVQQVERKLNTPLTSSTGRLFDAASALLGICPETTFEAQAAIALELAARRVDVAKIDPYAVDIGEGVIPLRALLTAMVADVLDGRSRDEIAAAFHVTLAAMFGLAAEQAREQTGIADVVLSGGVFQNRLFLRLMRENLRKRGFTVLSHRQVPANDGGLCVGQAVIASQREPVS